MLLTHYDDVNTITITTFFTCFHIFSIFLIQGKTEIKQLYTKLRLFQIALTLDILDLLQ